MTNYEYFEWCFKQIINLEGGMSKDTADLGNKDGNFTYMGLSSRYNPELKAIMRLSKDDRMKRIKNIYYTKYWQKSVNPVMSLVSPLREAEENNIIKHLVMIMFDTAVQCAPDDANRMLQRALNRIIWADAKYTGNKAQLLKVDGIIGNGTTLMLLRYLKYGVISSYMYLRSQKYLKDIGEKHNQSKFATGWMNRLIKIDNLIEESK